MLNTSQHSDNSVSLIHWHRPENRSALGSFLCAILCLFLPTLQASPLLITQGQEEITEAKIVPLKKVPSTTAQTTSETEQITLQQAKSEALPSAIAIEQINQESSALPSIQEVEAAEYPEQQIPFTLLGTEVQPGSSTILSWSHSQSIDGIASPAPVLVVHGTQPGPKLCITAAIHGDELNGIEIVRRVINSLDTHKLSGTLIGVPIVNLQGFHRASRYLADRRDLNRYFPGRPYGSSASRIAYSFFNQIVVHCDALVDLHTGSLHRTNLPQLRADLSNSKVAELTQSFGATVVLHHPGARGTLRRATTDAGIPAVTLETGGAMQLHEKPVTHGVKGILTLLYKMGMYKKSSLWGDPEPVYYKSTWVRINQGGILFSRVTLGQRVKQGQLLGTVTDPITNARQEIFATRKGRILGMALNQVVQPGFAAYRIGIQTSEEDMPDEEFEDEEGQENHPSQEMAPEEEPDLASSTNDPSLDRDVLEESE